MKVNNPTIVLGVALAIVSGLLTANVSGLMGQNSVDTIKTGAYMTGHVETILTDSDGNIIGYRQSDNLITNIGETCATKLLFYNDTVSGQGNAATTGTCSGALNSPWTFIALGTGTGTVNGTDTGLYTETSAAGLARARATTVTFTNSSGTGSTSAASVLIERTFTNTSGGTVTVTESGLFNETSSSATDSMFAKQVFGGIGVNNGDSLTVRWTINIGGTSGTLQQFS